MYNVISSGSQGNCIIYHESIVVDLGVSFSKIQPHLKDIQIVLLTHIHGDHFNRNTISKLAFERPSIRFAAGEHLRECLLGIRNVDFVEAGKVYDYGQFKISPVQLYHDVPNFGYRIFKGNHKTIHITDTSHVIGIEAKNYDLYAIEHNYSDDTVFESIEKRKLKGEFSHQIGAINSHLSEQQAKDFIYKNKGVHSQVLRLHESKNY